MWSKDGKNGPGFWWFGVPKPPNYSYRFYDTSLTSCERGTIIFACQEALLSVTWRYVLACHEGLALKKYARTK